MYDKLYMLHYLINAILLKVSVISDHFIDKYVRPTLEHRVRNVNVNRNLGTPNRHLIVCASRKISYGETKGY